MEEFKFKSEDNKVWFGKNLIIHGSISGENNCVEIGDSRHRSTLTVNINGNNNRIFIKNSAYIKGLIISIGNRIKANGVNLEIGENLSWEPGGKILLYNSGNNCVIGNNCLFSNTITIRCGESPHLIFDKTSGEYLDRSEGVFIGNHVWIGENVYITKKVTVMDESVIGARSVVTRRFTKTHVIIAGNPARVVKENIQWIRNHENLEKDSIFYKNYYENSEKYL